MPSGTNSSSPARLARAAAEAAPAMIAYWNAELRCEYANRAYRHWFGERAANILGTTLPELLGPELFGLNEPFVRGALRGEPQSFERQLTRPDGTVRFTLAQYLPEVADGVTRGFLAIVSEITDAKQAEAALRASEQRFHQILEVSPVPYALNDEHQNMTYVNPAFVRTFGYTLEEVSTLDRWWPTAYPDPEYRRTVVATWQQRFDATRATGRPPEPMEVRLRCKDGTTKIVMAYFALLQGRTGETCVDILLDVTDQRRLEQAMLERSGREQHQLGIALHEGLSQDLAALSLLLDGVGSNQAGETVSVSRRDLARLAEIARRCVATSRSFAQGLSPIELGNRGLAHALQQLATSARAPGGPDVSVHLEGFDRATVEPGFAESVYRIVQEVWGAAVGRAGVTRLSLDARLTPDRLRVAVSDDGAGRGPTAAAELAALDAVQFRARALGGVLELESAPAGGSVARLTCALPGR
jgi:PAS domain S-box-containing protein